MAIKLFQRTAGLLLICMFFLAGDLLAQGKEKRFLDYRVHKNGKIWVGVTNFGQFGTDQVGGAIWPGSDLPGHQPQYINRGGLFIGGIVPSDETIGPRLHDPGDLDTLVSEGPSAWSAVDYREMFPHYTDLRSAIEVRSSIPGSEFFHPKAVSEEDFIAVYTDTFSTDQSSCGFSTHTIRSPRPVLVRSNSTPYMPFSPHSSGFIPYKVIVK